MILGIFIRQDGGHSRSQVPRWSTPYDCIITTRSRSADTFWVYVSVRFRKVAAKEGIHSSLRPYFRPDNLFANNETVSRALALDLHSPLFLAKLKHGYLVSDVTNMYSDKDGTATEQSQAEYDARIRLLKSGTSLLSWLGFAAAVFSGEYARENLHFTRSLKQNDSMQWTMFLWASFFITHY